MLDNDQRRRLANVQAQINGLQSSLNGLPPVQRSSGETVRSSSQADSIASGSDRFYRVVGVDKNSGQDVWDIVSALTPQNAKVKLEIRGVIVTEVQEFPQGIQHSSSLTELSKNPTLQGSSCGSTNRSLYAGFWTRFAAAMLDAIILAMLTTATGLVISILSASGGEKYLLHPSVAKLLGLTFGWLYYAAMESSSHRGTFGKMTLGIEVTDVDGDRISFARATLRHFGKLISAIVLLFGFVMIAVTERKQGLHDLIAGCIVVRR
jgi:uncharacterized RDD family membrane protein YckC